jgi:hypothetical protein
MDASSLLSHLLSDWGKEFVEISFDLYKLFAGAMQ